MPQGSEGSCWRVLPDGLFELLGKELSQGREQVRGSQGGAVEPVGVGHDAEPYACHPAQTEHAAELVSVDVRQHHEHEDLGGDDLHGQNGHEVQEAVAHGDERGKVHRCDQADQAVDDVVDEAQQAEAQRPEHPARQQVLLAVGSEPAVEDSGLARELDEHG